MLKIKVFENAQSFYEKEYPIDTEITVGRAEHCGLVLRSKRISREHCRIFFQNNVWHIQDLNSQNGIRLNGDKILSEKLKHGDTLQIGDYRLEIILQDASSALPEFDADDRTVLLGGGMESDHTILSTGHFADADNVREGTAGKLIESVVKNKRLFVIAIAGFFLLIIIILISTSSKEMPDPETALLPAEQEKTEAMIDMESQHRITVYLESGKEQFDAGNYTEALVRFQAVLKLDPQNVVAQSYVGQSREKILELEEQRRVAADAEKERMERVAKIVSRARQAFRESDYAGALEIIAEAEFLAPGDSSVTALKTEIETAAVDQKNRDQDALQQKEAKLAGIRRHFDSGQQFYDQKNYHEALKEWELVLAAGLETPETAHVRHAIGHIRTLLEKDVRADYEQGKTYFNKKDYARAVSSLQKVARVLPGYQDTDKLLTDAVTELESIAKKLYQEGLVYEGIGQNEKAAAKWREVLTVMPVDSNQYYRRALEKLQ